MLVNMTVVLVKIAVMMVAPGGVPAPLEERGREPPSFFFFLDILPIWEKGFPFGPWLPWLGRGERPSEIGSVPLSLSVSVFWNFALAPFLLYPEIRNSDWFETFAQIVFQKLAFLRPKKGINRLTGCPRGSRARLPPWGVPPCLVAPSGTVSRWFFFPKIINIPKISSIRFYPIWTPFDMDILHQKHATDRNWHWTLDQYVSPKNSIKCCQKYMKVEEYLAWNNQKL